jgi:hypothetical protein
MIKEIKAYQLVCDECGTVYQEFDFTIFDDIGIVGEAIDCWGWIEKDNKHYCPNCVDFAEYERNELIKLCEESENQ